jgi:hypothetical protein
LGVADQAIAFARSLTVRLMAQSDDDEMSSVTGLFARKVTCKRSGARDIT